MRLSRWVDTWQLYRDGLRSEFWNTTKMRLEPCRDYEMQWPITWWRSKNRTGSWTCVWGIIFLHKWHPVETLYFFSKLSFIFSKAQTLETSDTLHWTDGHGLERFTPKSFFISKRGLFFFIYFYLVFVYSQSEFIVKVLTNKSN